MVGLCAWPVQVNSTALEVLKVFGPNVTEASMQKRHDGITLTQWVRGVGRRGKGVESCMP